MHKTKTTDARKLGVAIVARAVAGRPDHRTGKQYFEILPPLLGCDTKSRADGQAIVANAHKYCASGMSQARLPTPNPTHTFSSLPNKDILI